MPKNPSLEFADILTTFNLQNCILVDRSASSEFLCLDRYITGVTES